MYELIGLVPPGSPLRRLIGRTVTVRTDSIGDLVARRAEMRRAHIRPVLWSTPTALDGHR